MSYWLFQADPNRYRVLDALAERDEMSWQVNQHAPEIHQGDGVFIWKAGDDAGVYAVAEVVSEPTVAENSSDPFWVGDDKKRAATARLRVSVRILHRLLESPVLRASLLADPLMQSLSILRFAQGTNFPVSEEEWQRIRAWQV